MNCYDFDKTIYKDDSSWDFYKFCLKHYPVVIRRWPMQLAAFVGHYVLHIISKTRMKELFYQYFQDIPDMEKVLEDFWTTHMEKIQPFYKACACSDDIIISASPSFFLRPACEMLGIEILIASQVNAKTGQYEGENCHGEEKVRRFRALYPHDTVEAFYSDSLSDTPMARIAQKAYIIRGGKVLPWPSK
ncbi:MAG: hypothetical protein E7393_06540 [Ruminococcaceae bacterium]|nr:hypothetical protein [Oscillospiraceae bacterium]